MQKSDLSLFLDLSNIPTTSFYENLVSDFIKSKLKEYDLSFSEDKWGNIEVLLSGETEKEIVYISHMDHPGFEIVDKIADNLYKAKTLGGLPKLCDQENTKVKIISGNDHYEGKLIPLDDPNSDK